MSPSPTASCPCWARPSPRWPGSRGARPRTSRACSRAPGLRRRAAGDDRTLEQLLVIAEFDGDPDAQARLADGLRWGNFTHIAQQLRDARADREARQKILDDAAAHGIPVVDGAGYDHT